MTTVTAPKRAASERRTRTNFVLFTLAAAVVPWLGVLLDRASGAATGTASTTSTGGGTAGQGLWLVLPAVLVVLLYLFRRDSAGQLGFRMRFPNRARWFSVAAFAYPATALPVVLLGVAVGLVSVSGEPTAGSPAFVAAILSTVGFVVIKNVFEEFIFRGYGTRTALALGLRGVAPHLLVGAVWALWHAPLYLVWMSRADLAEVTSLPPALFFAASSAGIVVLAVLYGELRAITGSIWPGVVLHTVSNVIATALLVNGHLRFDGHADVLFAPAPHGLAFCAATALAAVLLIRRTPDPTRRLVGAGRRDARTEVTT